MWGWPLSLARWEGPRCKVIVLEPHLSQAQAEATEMLRRFVGLRCSGGSKSKQRAHSRLMKLISDWNRHS